MNWTAIIINFFWCLTVVICIVAICNAVEKTDD